VIDLDDSFKRFFKKQTGYPKFKSRKRDKDSFRVPQQVKIDFDSKKVYIPKFKEGIKYKDDRTFNPEQIRNATVSKTKSGKFFISIVVDDGITITPTKEE
jgi:putative transposase